MDRAATSHPTGNHDGESHSLIASKWVCSGEHPYHIEATVTFCGSDLIVVIGGGEAAHVGAVALGVPRPSLANPDQPSASVSVLCVTGHKEDEFARAAALELAIRFGCRVVVTVGIHIDDAEPCDLKILAQSYQRVCERVASAIQEVKGLES